MVTHRGWPWSPRSSHCHHRLSAEMIIHCPKCAYSRKSSDSAPPGECPSCGVVFDEFLTGKRPSNSSAQVSIAPESRSESNTKSPNLTTCPTCGGRVATNAKVCPHCGQANPAPKEIRREPTKVTKTHLVIAALLLIAFFYSAGNRPEPMSAQEATRHCAGEAGLDPDSGQPVSMEHLRRIDTCLHRLGFKTR